MRVPTYDRNTVAPAAMPGVRVSDQAGQRLAQSVGRAAQALDDHAARLDEAAVRELDVEYSTFERDALYGAEGYYSKLGRNAMDARPQVEKALADKRREIVGRASTQRQRDQLEQMLGRRYEATLGGVARFGLEQEKAYERETQSAVLATRTEDAAAAFRAGDVERFDVLRGVTRAEALKAAEMSGLDGVAAQRAGEEAVSRVHAYVLADLIDRDPVAARAHLDRYGGEMTEKDRATFAPRVDDAATKIEIARTIEGRPPADLAEAVDFIIDGPEGGTRPVDLGDGAGLTVGGVTSKWHPDLFEGGKTPTRAQVAERLKTYADADVKRLLKDDPALGLAYLDARINQGPDKAAAMLKRADGDFAAFMAERRKEYAKGDPRFRKGWENRLQQIETRAAGLSENATLAEGLAVADAIGGSDPARRETARAMVKARMAEREQVKRDAEARAWDEAQPYVQAGTSWTQWPASVFTALSPQQQTAVKAAEAKGASRQSDPRVFADVYTLAATNPEAFKGADLTKLLPDLSRDDYESLVKMQANARRGVEGWGADKPKVTVEATNRVFNLIKPAGLKKDDEQTFKAALFKSASDAARVKGDALTDEELMQLGNRLAVEVVVGKGLFGDKTRPLYTFGVENGKAEGYGAIPQAERARLVADFTAKFGRAPTTGEVVERWRTLKAVGRL